MRTGVANLDLLSLHLVAARVGGRTRVDGVAVVEAPADGIPLHELDAHGGGGDVWFDSDGGTSGGESTSGFQLWGLNCMVQDQGEDLDARSRALVAVTNGNI